MYDWQKQDRGLVLKIINHKSGLSELKTEFFNNFIFNPKENC